MIVKEEESTTPILLKYDSAKNVPFSSYILNVIRLLGRFYFLNQVLMRL